MSDDFRGRDEDARPDDSPYPWMSGELEEDVSQPFKPWMIAVALASMAIFLIAVWYAWNEGKSANDGPPPIVQADDTPVKVAPEEPGGMDVPHRENEVFAAIEDSPAVEPVEELLPPPEEPLDRPEPAPETPTETETEPAAQTAEATEAPAPAAETAPDPAPAEPQAAEPAPTQSTESQPTQAQPTETQPAQPAPEPESEPAPAAEAPAAQAGTSGASGKYVIQLAALSSRAAAERAWSRLLKAHTQLLGPLTLDVEPVEVEGQGMFYRVRGDGFDTEAAARKHCDALKTAGQACLVKAR